MLTRKLAGFILIAFLVSGCNNTSINETVGEGENPYHQQFQEALRDSEITDFERTVIVDEIITEDEYQEAVAKYDDCMEKLGDKVLSKNSNETKTSTTGSFDANLYLKHNGECVVGTTNIIKRLYDMIKYNPNNIDEYTLIAQCLVRRNLVTEGFSGHDYEEIEKIVSEPTEYEKEHTFTKGDKVGYFSPPGGTKKPNPVFPGGRSWNDPEIQRCQIEPTEKDD